MNIHVFVLIITAIFADPSNAPVAAALAKPFPTLQSCQAAGEAFIDTVQETKPDGVLGVVAGCQDITVAVPAPKAKDSI